MRYTETKARSAELLRLTLAHMGHHSAAFNPLTFTLWYEYASGMNPKLNAAIELRLGQAQPVDDATVLSLYREHIAPADTEQVELIAQEMQRLMKTVSDSASETGHQAGTFGVQLNELSEVLETQSADTTLKPHLERVREGTVGMKLAVDTLQNRVNQSQSEIQRLRSDLERTREEAMLDPLTGLLNRKGFDQRLQALLSHPTQPGESHCLLMLDIDHFKSVNDTHGHLMGDRVIQGLSEILRTSVTRPTQAVARYGGEEFAIVLPQTSKAEAVQIAETIRARTKAMKLRNRSTQEVVLTVTISSGVAEWRPGDDAHSLIARADAALYASKKNGRDRVTCH
ncbi:GGDEF domain-containing protein [Curvibacter sp. RS43]|uniref:diguanylate cyclase n=1 Tax=Curvibacter microcysteis TaxID=3026419 RepID=A0ABT5M8W4_9BURK|nr:MULTISPECIES: GGDEF domain-containing protein [unclassified Curvibacter]MDD0812054.1 GGDEF domain-containing protein [Curvibacter sp. RS43]MDD0813018.1 GGDEF domain-containing protein [Curvibacter sp. HBC28]